MVRDLRVWIQCYKCEKWRVAHPSMKSEQLPHAWCCSDNTWAPEYASCRIPQEPHLANEEDVNDDANNVASTLAGMSNENKEEERQWNIPPSVNNRKIIPKEKREKQNIQQVNVNQFFLQENINHLGPVLRTIHEIH